MIVRANANELIVTSAIAAQIAYLIEFVLDATIRLTRISMESLARQLASEKRTWAAIVNLRVRMFQSYGTSQTCLLIPNFNTESRAMTAYAVAGN